MLKKSPKLLTFLKKLKEPDQYPGFLLWQTSNIWYRNMNNTLKEFGITFTQFTILTSLIYLSKHKININQKQIAQHAKLDIMMTSDVLKKLEAKKLVIRFPNPKDRRHNSLKITPQGVKLLLKIFPCVYEADIKFFEVLGDNEKSLVTPLKELIRANYDSIYLMDADK
jgi:DNA-binding MarR family transcriptional regulator